jgi:hypothetical protein
MEEKRTTVIETPPTPETREVTQRDLDQIDSYAYDPYEGRRIAGDRLTQLVYWVFGIVEGLIAIRLILKALGANQTAGFAQFIYGITAPLVGPFVGLFNNPTYQNDVLELGSIVALIVYALAAWVVAKLVWILVGETRSGMRTHSTHIDSRV